MTKIDLAIISSELHDLLGLMKLIKSTSLITTCGSKLDPKTDLWKLSAQLSDLAEGYEKAIRNILKQRG